MFGFTYLGGRGTATTFRASLLLPTGKDAAFWDAQSIGLITPGPSIDTYYTTEKHFVVAIGYEGIRQYYGVLLQPDAPYLLTIKDPDGVGYFKWIGKIIRAQALLKRISLDSALYKAIKYQPTISDDLSKKFIEVELLNRVQTGRRIAARKVG